jgi:hypothetical protein
MKSARQWIELAVASTYLRSYLLASTQDALLPLTPGGVGCDVPSVAVRRSSPRKRPLFHRPGDPRHPGLVCANQYS